MKRKTILVIVLWVVAFFLALLGRRVFLAHGR